MHQETYERFMDLPLDQPVPLTALTGEPEKYADYADQTYCSQCGRNSHRRRRDELWMMLKLHKNGQYHTRFYCIDHYPGRGGQGTASHREQHKVNEVMCNECFLVCPATLSECDNCGAPLVAPEGSQEDAD